MDRVTQDHMTIKKWAEDKNGKPAVIDDSDSGLEKPGLKIDFPGGADEAFLGEGQMRHVSWDEFFDLFENQKLSFMFKEKPDQDLSLSYKFIPREGI